MPPPEQNKRYALYIRVATNGYQAMLDIAKQADAAAKWAPDNEAQIVATYTDKAANGRSENRPAFQQMIQDALNPDKPFDGILVTHYSRFARSIVLHSKYSRMLRKFHITIVSISEARHAKFIRSMVESVAEHARETNRRAQKQRKSEPTQSSE